MKTFARNIGGSPYWGVTTLYDDTFGGHVSSQVGFQSSNAIIDSYSLGSGKTTLSKDDVWAIVNNAITSGRLKRDTNGVYFVLTSADIDQFDGFLFLRKLLRLARIRLLDWHQVRVRGESRPMRWDLWLESGPQPELQFCRRPDGQLHRPRIGGDRHRPLTRYLG